MGKESNRQDSIPFAKVHGAGNDALIVEECHWRHVSARAKPGVVRRIAHRSMGIGADQVLEVLSRSPLRFLVWNQDGSRAEMCANGTRSLCFYALRKGWFGQDAAVVSSVVVEVGERSYSAKRLGAGFSISLGVPVVGAAAILTHRGQRVPYVPVSVGNPHAVIFASGGRGDWRAPKDFDFRVWGAELERHKVFPKRANVEFVRRLEVSGRRAWVETEFWERGSGATLSCGTGAVAVASALKARLPGVREVLVRMTEFELRVNFDGSTAWLSGPSALVAEGVWTPEY